MYHLSRPYLAGSRAGPGRRRRYRGIRLLRLFNSAGAEVLHRTQLPANGFDLNLGGLPPGFYWMPADGAAAKLIVSRQP
ncbi:MAG: hypothetical protein IPH12_20655 [Saprospirales bacterium]|jgi:hypothetical protein|nr:hypothetical protein [Saprospirales bacterium]MBK8923255.1 hypothetical protein [Saprospirales bacterium]